MGIGAGSWNSDCGWVQKRHHDWSSMSGGKVFFHWSWGTDFCPSGYKSDTQKHVVSSALCCLAYESQCPSFWLYLVSETFCPLLLLILQKGSCGLERLILKVLLMPSVRLLVKFRFVSRFVKMYLSSYKTSMDGAKKVELFMLCVHFPPFYLLHIT